MKRLIVCLLPIISACLLRLTSCAGGGEWYLEQQTYRELPSPSVPLSMRGYSVNTPKTQTVTADGLELTAELFCDSYKLGEVLQARFTIKNTSDNVILYINGKTGTDQGSIFRGDGEVLEYEVLSEQELATNATDAIELITLEPGETVVRERAYVLYPDFFGEDETFTLVYRCDSLDGQDITAVLGSCRLEIVLTVDK